MQFTTALTTLLAAVAVSASPVTLVEKRACSVAPGVPGGFSINKSTSQTVTFNVPAGSYGCSLEAVWPTNYPISGTSPSVDVFAVGGPAPGSLVGTVTFASDPSAPRRQFINSFACATSQSYTFSIASWQASGAVSWVDRPGAGLVMTYNC